MPPKYQKRYKKSAVKKAPKEKTSKALTVKDVKKIAKAVMQKNTETKFVVHGAQRATLYHNGGTTGTSGAYQYNLFNNTLPTQGSTESSRDGNEIYIRGVKLNLLITLPYDRLATKVIMYVFKCNRGVNLLTSYDQIFDNVSANWLLDNVDTGRVKVLYKKIVSCGTKINPNVPVAGANRELTLARKIWIPINKKMVFQDDTATSGTGNNLPYDYVAVFAAYDAWGSLTSDICAYVKVDAKLYFKDM